MTKYAQSDNIVTAIFEQHNQGVSGRQIAKNLDISRDEVVKYILFIKEKKCLSAQDLIAHLAQFNNTKNQELNIKTYSIDEQEEAYAYLLGMYLGDGCISEHPRAFCLRIFLDYKYPKIIERVEEHMKIIFPNNKVSRVIKHWKDKPSCTELKIYNKNIPDKFPQHGIGKKHDRDIVLESWQQVIVDKYPKQFLRGLFESDGSRYTSKVKKKDSEEYYEYNYYNFTNVSRDIIDIVSNRLTSLNIKHRIAYRKRHEDVKGERPWDLTISTREDVAFMDTFIGPKE